MNTVDVFLSNPLNASKISALGREARSLRSAESCWFLSVESFFLIGINYPEGDVVNCWFWLMDDERWTDSIVCRRGKRRLTSPRFPASRTYSSRTSCSSGDKDSSPVAPGLLSRPDIVDLCWDDLCWQFRDLILVLVVRSDLRLCFDGARYGGVFCCVHERNKRPSECFGFVGAKASNWQGAPPFHRYRNINGYRGGATW